MEKRSTINFIIILAVLAIAGLTMGLYDYNIALHGNMPKFVFASKSYDDGGTVEYTGFLYKIIKYGAVAGRSDVAFGSLLMKYDPQIDEAKLPKKISMPNVKFNFTGTIENIKIEDGNLKIQLVSATNENILVSVISSSLIYKNGVKATKNELVVDSTVKCKINMTNTNVVPNEAMAQVINIIE